ncbi:MULTISPECIES: metallophosphoesterase [unclassified Novosphingobium]|uniref:metallophosphoesterase family protein n=1 Tax=unclassified Novosphingobium TaxID=2644732 RepID=UPI000D2FAA86|nr:MULTISPECIES: metallophosphoesterase family protein [unclassified Novosphingobium]PTR12569.1 hypothetical protein C8K11_10222 [Novosphingobium sp. GV055]PUB06353.1 hypothetical protein C8K12_10222 [Novosphingobium sp. GV061]PUB22404.1 hypothetical protein C8K14_10222 [Novosphingobium sp. GV079]PUB44429.1 hypothetical protein C8K10_10222 [Novosphingobium sp. GV027]
MRVGIVSDIHGQARALRQAITAMGPIDRLICLGDAISEASFSNDTVELLRSHDALAILGNHEEAFFAGHGPRAASVDTDLANWLAARPTRIVTWLGGRRVLIVHSTPWRSGHAYVSQSHRDFHRMAEPGFDIVLYGHTHQPVVREVGATLIVNPGSLGEGRPTEQGFVRSYAMLDLTTREARIVDLD